MQKSGISLQLSNVVPSVSVDPDVINMCEPSVPPDGRPVKSSVMDRDDLLNPSLPITSVSAIEYI